MNQKVLNFVVLRSSYWRKMFILREHCLKLINFHAGSRCAPLVSPAQQNDVGHTETKVSVGLCPALQCAEEATVLHRLYVATPSDFQPLSCPDLAMRCARCLNTVRLLL